MGDRMRSSARVPDRCAARRPAAASCGGARPGGSMAPMPGEAGDDGVPAGGVSAHGGHGTQSASSANSLPPLNVEAKLAKRRRARNQVPSPLLRLLRLPNAPRSKRLLVPTWIQWLLTRSSNRAPASLRSRSPLPLRPLPPSPRKVMDDKALTSVSLHPWIQCARRHLR